MSAPQAARPEAPKWSAALVRVLLDHFVAVATVAALVGYVAVYAFSLNGPPIRSDGFSYYVYLPAVWIYGDPTMERVAADCCGGTFPAFATMVRWPGTGHWVNPHPMGEAVLLLPFFLAADALTRWSNLSRDGFSFYYQNAAGLAGLCYFSAGLAVLKRVLLDHFSAGVVLATLFSIVWGTNLFHYATYDSIFSHVFSFFLFALLLHAGSLWPRVPNRSRACALGILAGLIVLVRHTDALLLIFPALHGVHDLRALRERAVQAWDRRGETLLFALAAVVTLLPQLALYRYGTGSWLSSPYAPHGSLDFTSPKVPQVLFSTQKGLFFWSPLLALAVIGVAFMRRYARDFLLPTLVVLPVMVWVTASWSDWQFGGSYGHRGFTDLMPIFGVALASFYARVRGTPWRGPVFMAATAAVALSVAQMLQYWLGTLPFNDTSWALYRAHFLKFGP